MKRDIRVTDLVKTPAGRGTVTGITNVKAENGPIYHVQLPGGTTISCISSDVTPIPSFPLVPTEANHRYHTCDSSRTRIQRDIEALESTIRVYTQIHDNLKREIAAYKNKTAS